MVHAFIHFHVLFLLVLILQKDNMGVKGLTSFVEQQRDLLWEYELHDTKVIIDG